MAEVGGDLMQGKSLKLGVVDTLTGGQLARDLIESGYSDLVATDLSPANLTEALKDSGADTSNPPAVEEARSYAVSLAESVTPPDGIGLAMIGPFEESSTFIALNGPGEVCLFERSRNYQDTELYSLVVGCPSVRLDSTHVVRANEVAGRLELTERR